MSLVPYENWSPMSRLRDDLGWLIGSPAMNIPRFDTSSSATADYTPVVDIEEFPDHFKLFVDVPGVNTKGIDVTLDQGVLTVSGEREKRVYDDEPTHLRNERAYGRFYRRFVLPDTIDADSVKASGRDGVLEIEIRKVAKAQPRRIKIAA